jgi:hypothetical protein
VKRVILALALVALACAIPLIAGCQAGQNGGVALAFIRAGALYRMQPDGQDLYQVAPAPVIGFAWSPDHHQFVARFAPRNTAHPTVPFSDVAPDTPAALGVVSIDGGNITIITPSSPSPARSDPWWNTNGNRLMFREQGGGVIQWILSQADQPSGIAQKAIAQTAVIPTTAPDAGQIATITDAGDLAVGPPQGTPHTLANNAIRLLPSGWPVRPEWQPRHQAILYATLGATADTTALELVDLHGHVTPVASATQVNDYFWSPDGAQVVIRTAAGFTLHHIAGEPDYTWPDASAYTAAWWSPDSRYLLTRNATQIALIDSRARTAKTLITFTPNGAPAAIPTAARANAWPLATSPWRDDSGQLALALAGGTWYDGSALTTRAGAGTGLYLITPGNLTHRPAPVEWGEHTALSWSSLDPNAACLAA